MADQLVTEAELEVFTGALDTTTAVLLIELATGKVQAACGQRLVEVTDTAVLEGSTCDRLTLPQWPVQSVTTVKLDGTVITDWALKGMDLWRLNGWQAWRWEPSVVTVTYKHGYPTGDQYLQLARDAVLSLAIAGYGNPGGAVESESIDDYSVTFADADERMVVTDAMRDRLKDAYGHSAYVTGSR